MKRLLPLAAFLALAACDETAFQVAEPEKPKGPPITIVEAARALDTTRVVMRYEDGSAIPSTDEARAIAKGAEIACREGEDTLPDTREYENGLLTVKYFCVGVLTSDQVIDGSGLRT